MVTDENVVQIATKTKSTMHVNAALMLREILADIESGRIDASKLVVIGINSDSEHWGVYYRSCQLRVDEIVSACEAVKHLAMRVMGSG